MILIKAALGVTLSPSERRTKARVPGEKCDEWVEAYRADFAERGIDASVLRGRAYIPWDEQEYLLHPRALADSSAALQDMGHDLRPGGSRVLHASLNEMVEWIVLNTSR
eukprot:TRINITY_DN2268_c0_g3_i1.p5 TRINITY_DN2268_c0_g3~~TRINITY_DN2268_c0_g3_i1.p5  ORF type:complete len:109 (-),score=26.16 TRINITY_DN2268_c0_g3_i1:53-379(-)